MQHRGPVDGRTRTVVGQGSRGNRGSRVGRPERGWPDTGPSSLGLAEGPVGITLGICNSFTLSAGEEANCEGLGSLRKAIKFASGNMRDRRTVHTSEWYTLTGCSGAALEFGSSETLRPSPPQSPIQFRKGTHIQSAASTA